MASLVRLLVTFDVILKNQTSHKYRYMENIVHFGIYGNITDTIWSCPRYHGESYECKIWSVVIIIAHRKKLGGLITLFLLELAEQDLRSPAHQCLHRPYYLLFSGAVQDIRLLETGASFSPFNYIVMIFRHAAQLQHDPCAQFLF